MVGSIVTRPRRLARPRHSPDEVGALHLRATVDREATAHRLHPVGRRVLRGQRLERRSRGPRWIGTDLATARKVTPSVCDERNERMPSRQLPWVRARAIVGLAAGGLIQVAAWGCKQRTEVQASATPRSVETSATGVAPANAPSPSPGAGPIRERTTRGQMLSHYADTIAMRRALVAGKLADYQGSAAAVANDEWAPNAPAEQRELTLRVRSAAATAQATTSLVGAAQALGALGDVCASCHLASGAPQLPIAPEAIIEASNPHMLAHAIAADQLWAGLTLPSDESWASGIQLLLEDPELAAPSDEVSAAARLLRELASRGERAEPDERGRLFADVVVTCSGCHERLGVVLEDDIAVH